MHLGFLLARAKGEVKTGARLQRDFITSHPEYKRDSVVSPTIAYELVESVLAYSNSSEVDQKMEHFRCQGAPEAITNVIKRQQSEQEIPSPPKV